MIMRDCDKELLTVPLKLSPEDIRLLAYEYEQTESSAMTIFIEDILRETDRVARETEQSCIAFMNANPFSKNKSTGEAK